MAIYVAVIALILISSYLFRKNKKALCITSGIILWLLLACRSISVGLNDTENVYLPYFNMLFDMNLKEIFLYRFMSDKVFFILMKIITLFSANYQICIAILAIPFVAFVMKAIYDYSEDALFSTIIFIALYYAYGFFLLKQVIAIGIIVYSYKYIKENNLKKFFITVIIASMFHSTALIFLVAYPICKYVKAGYKNYFAVIIAFILGRYALNITIFIFRSIPLFNKYVYSIEHGIYEVNNGLSIWGLLITLVIWSVSHYFYKSSKNDNKEINKLLNISTIGSVLYCFSASITEFYRVALYFSIFNILLLPNAINLCEDKKLKNIITVFSMIIFIAYFFTRTIFNTNLYPYKFFL